MTDDDRINITRELERVRAQLYACLYASATARARDGAPPSSGDQEAVAGTLAYRSWKLLGEAIEALQVLDHRARGAESAQGLPEFDDLTRIRGISTELADRLVFLGIARYAQIADWRSHDVRRVSQELGLTREISTQNWIEQAALLQRRKDPQPEVPSTIPSKTSAQLAKSESVAQEPEPKIELPEIIQVIRDDAQGVESSPPAVPFNLASHLPNEPGVAHEAGPESDPPRSLADDASAVTPGSEHEPAAADISTRAASTDVRKPTVAPGAHAKSHEGPRNIEQPDQLQTWSSGQFDNDRLHYADEAGVTIVIREQTIRQVPSSPTSTSVTSDDAQSISRRRPSVALHDASHDPADEAEVIVLKPHAQAHTATATRPEGGRMRRFLQALKHK